MIDEGAVLVCVDDVWMGVGEVEDGSVVDGYGVDEWD